MATSVSKSTAYAATTDFVTYHDIRQLTDLINDDGTRATQGTFEASAVVTAHLNAAAGMIEAACFRAGTYTTTDLAALAGVSLVLLKKLNIELAYWSLWTRRHPHKELLPVHLWALDLIDQLSKGSRIFSLQGQVDAGLPDHDYLGYSEFNKRGEITDQSQRYHGRRAKIRRVGGAWYGGGYYLEE